MFHKLPNIFPKIKTGFPITQTVVDKIQQGDVYAYDENLFISHKNGFSSFIKITDCLEELIVLFTKEEIHKYFHVYDASEELITKILQYPKLFNAKVRNRIQLEYIEKEHLNIEDIKGYYIEKIQDSNFLSLSSFDLDLSNRFWRNKADFIKESKGIVVFDHYHEPVSICYAAAIADGKAEIDVFTKENYRSKGIAKMAVTNFIANCVNDNITPNWDCFKENLNSLKIALSLNFKFKKEYILLSIYRYEI